MSLKCPHQRKTKKWQERRNSARKSEKRATGARLPTEMKAGGGGGGVELFVETAES